MRSKSQRLCSAAVNFLIEEHAGKKKRTWRRRKINNIGDAIGLLNEAASIDPTDPLPHYLLGISLAMTGKYEQALDALRRANKLDPNEPEVLLTAGLAQFLAGNYDASASIFSKLLEQSKRKAPIHVCLGYAYMRGGDFDTALEHLTKAVRLEPALQAAQQGLATVYYLAGDLESARRYARHSQSIRSYPPVMLMLAKLDYLQGMDLEGYSLLKKLKRKSRKYRHSHRSMTAVGYTKQHDFQWDPFEMDQFDGYWLVRARALDQQKRARRRDSYARKGHVEDRLNQIGSEMSAKPNDFFLLHERGLLEMSSGKFKTAAETFKRVLELCPDCHIDKLNIAHCLMESGNSSEAGVYMGKYRELYKDSKLASRYQSIPVSGTASATSTARKLPTMMKKAPGKKQPQRTRPPTKDPFPF